MKAIILAAGMGTRLDKYTKELPKCMLNFEGKTLIKRQVETLRSCGIKEIIIIYGDILILEAIILPILEAIILPILEVIILLILEFLADLQD